MLFLHKNARTSTRSSKIAWRPWNLDSLWLRNSNREGLSPKWSKVSKIGELIHLLPSSIKGNLGSSWGQIPQRQTWPIKDNFSTRLLSLQMEENNPVSEGMLAGSTLIVINSLKPSWGMRRKIKAGSQLLGREVSKSCFSAQSIIELPLSLYN